MRLASLDYITETKPVVVLLCAESNTMVNFIKNIFYTSFTHQVDAEIHIKTTNDLDLIDDISSVLPPFSNYWLVDIDIENLDTTNGIITRINKAKNTCIFLLVCSTYKNYKRLLTDIRNKQIKYLDYYMNKLNANAMSYIMSKTHTEKTTEITARMQKYILKNYSNKVEELLLLIEAVNDGYEVNNAKDIEQICGVPDIHTDEFILNLIAMDWSKKPRGLNTQIKNKIKQITGMGESLGFDTLYNYINTSFITLIKLKGYIISDTLDLDNIQNSELSLKEQERFRRLLYYKDEINSIPLSEVLVHYSLLGDKWYEPADAMSFIYKIVEKKKG